MSVGRMNRVINIISAEPAKDADGFVTKGDNVLATIRAFKEERRGTTKWANLAAFSNATVLYRFRVIPGLEITTSLIIKDDTERFNITSIDKTKGRGMYIEVYGEKLEGTVR